MAIKLSQQWLYKVSREPELPKFSNWNPLEGLGEPNNDKSQDTKWLREGFLHRGAEIDWCLARLEAMTTEWKYEKRRHHLYVAAFFAMVALNLLARVL